MLAAEALFDGAPLAHVVAWEEHQRMRRIQRGARVLERRTGSRRRKIQTVR